jgi:hypothetical protein
MDTTPFTLKSNNTEAPVIHANFTTSNLKNRSGVRVLAAYLCDSYGIVMKMAALPSQAIIAMLFLVN